MTVPLKNATYLLEEEKLISNLKQLKAFELASAAKIILALKGFALWRTFDVFLEHGFDEGAASSLHEARLIVEQLHSRPHTYCVAYDEESFKTLAKNSSHLTFNSWAQFLKFEPHIAEHKHCLFGLRINPLYSEIDTPLYDPADQQSRLGIQPDCLDFSSPPPKALSGLHFHALCENDAATSIRVLDAFLERVEPWLQYLSWLNIGGGHLITKKGYDGVAFAAKLKALKRKYNLQVYLEPSSAFVWQTGDLHTKILDIVSGSKYDTLIINASFTCHMPDCLEMPYKPEAELHKISSSAKKQSWRGAIGGVSCLAGDVISGFEFANTPTIGDTIIFKDMMHYTMVKTSFFNGVQHPDIGIKYADGTVEIVRSFGYEDFKGRLG